MTINLFSYLANHVSKDDIWLIVRPSDWNPQVQQHIYQHLVRILDGDFPKHYDSKCLSVIFSYILCNSDSVSHTTLFASAVYLHYISGLPQVLTPASMCPTFFTYYLSAQHCGLDAIEASLWYAKDIINKTSSIEIRNLLVGLFSLLELNRCFQLLSSAADQLESCQYPLRHAEIASTPYMISSGYEEVWIKMLFYVARLQKSDKQMLNSFCRISSSMIKHGVCQRWVACPSSGEFGRSVTDDDVLK